MKNTIRRVVVELDEDAFRYWYDSYHNKGGFSYDIAKNDQLTAAIKLGQESCLAHMTPRELAEPTDLLKAAFTMPAKLWDYWQSMFGKGSAVHIEQVHGQLMNAIETNVLYAMLEKADENASTSKKKPSPADIWAAIQASSKL